MGKAHSLRPELWKALLIGLCVCAFRLAIFDYEAFFSLDAIPNHDSYSGAVGFVTSLHALRLGGDIAWWLPNSIGGYPLNYNFFLSPLAPTAGNPVFLIWSQVDRILVMLGIIIPEYRQFLVFHFVLMPILAYAALALLCRRFAKGWAASILAVVAYAYSGTGLWNNSWMFYQEWANVFFALWALDLFVRRTSTKALAFLSIAVVLIISSFNYWTVFSVWFIVTWIVGHACLYRRSWARAAAWLWASRSRLDVLALVATVFLVCGLWSILLLSVYLEQSAQLVRSTGGELVNGFSLSEVYGRAQATGIKFFTSEFFNPILDRALKNYPVINAIHNARYVGIALLPLIILFFIYPIWRRYDRLLMVVFVVMISIAMTSGIFLELWRVMPGMSMMRHAFYFNQYFLQIILILIGARMLSVLLMTPPRRVTGPTLALTGAAGIAGIVYLFIQGEAFVASDDVKAKSIGYASLLLVVASLLLWRAALARTTFDRRLIATVFFLFVAGDYTHYYWVASKADRTFTAEFRKVPATLAPETKEAFGGPWQVRDPQALGFSGGIFANMPIGNSSWPTNEFNKSLNDRAFALLSADQQKIAALETLAGLIPGETTVAPDTLIQATPIADATVLEWDYNRVVFSGTAESAGLLVSSMTYDAGWMVSVDGTAVATQRANLRLLAFPVAAGAHRIEMEFRPTSRSIYPFAVIATLAGLILLIIVGLRSGRNRRIAVGTAG